MSVQAQNPVKEKAVLKIIDTERNLNSHGHSRVIRLTECLRYCKQNVCAKIMNLKVLNNSYYVSENTEQVFHFYRLQLLCLATFLMIN